MRVRSVNRTVISGQTRATVGSATTASTSSLMPPVSGPEYFWKAWGQRQDVGVSMVRHLRPSVARARICGRAFPNHHPRQSQPQRPRFCKPPRCSLHSEVEADRLVQAQSADSPSRGWSAAAAESALARLVDPRPIEIRRQATARGGRSQRYAGHRNTPTGCSGCVCATGRHYGDDDESENPDRAATTPHLALRRRFVER